MDIPLGRYVRAAHGLGGPELLTKTNRLSEQLDEGVLDETVYRFADGAVLRYTLVQDEGNFDVSADGACLPCEISYEVLAHPSQDKIVPERKRFGDQCRYLFWLKMQR